MKNSLVTPVCFWAFEFKNFVA